MWVGGCDDEVQIKFFYCVFFLLGVMVVLLLVV
jgi:hypothetical protein